MDARTAGDNNVDVLRAIRNSDVVRVASFSKPARATMAKSLYAALGKSSQGNPRALEYCFLDFLLADAVVRHARGMFRADDEQRSGRKDDVVVTETQGRADDLVENVMTRLAAVCENVLRGRSADHCDGTVVRAESCIDMEWRPRAVVFRFGEASREFSSVAVGSHVGLAGNIAADVAEHELYRTTDRGVGACALSERVAAGVDVNLFGNRSVDKEERRGRVGGGLDAVKLAVIVQERVDRGEHHREIFRPAPRKHGVDGDLLDRRLPPA